MNFSGKLPFNWFDILVIVVLMVGYARGRKHGMSKELLQVIKWLTVVLVGAIGYEPMGLWLHSTVSLGKLASFIISYCFIAAFVLLLFMLLNETLGRKLAGTDTFGKGEFYLAMPAGMLRFACILMVLLALLNARLYTTAEVKAMKKFQDDNYGSQFFPTLSSVQGEVFEESFVGQQIRTHASFLLIKPTFPNDQKNVSSRNRREFTLP